MKKIILARHGETRWNIEGRTQGSMDSCLTEKGLKQALLLSEKLQKEKIDGIYSSNLKRAMTTAEIIGEGLRIEPIFTGALAELGFGAWEGLTVEEIIAKYPNELKAWHSTPQTALIPNAEKLEEGQKRVVNFIDSLVENNTINNALIVSHGTVLKLFLLAFLNMSLQDFYKLKIDNCSITTIEFKDRGAVLMKYNDTSHLDLSLEGEENVWW